MEAYLGRVNNKCKGPEAEMFLCVGRTARLEWQRMEGER